MGLEKDRLDFVIAGVQKAGTTSLFRYLEYHPHIYLLSEKEGPFFNNDERFARGWEWYLEEFFADAPRDKLWGKATPDYTADPRVPERLYKTLPQIRIIILLRNPIDRAYSHFRMSIRKGIEDRSFADAITEQLEASALVLARKQPTPTNSYIVRGEYHRILSSFYQFFPSQQICLLDFDTLKNSPVQLLRDTLRFLDLTDDFMPANIGVVYHKGGTRLRLSWVPTLRKFWFTKLFLELLPNNYRRRFSYWFAQWNVVTQDPDPIDTSIRRELECHYQPELDRLRSLTGFQLKCDG